MQIVIDIPEGTYDLIKHNVQAQSAFENAFYAIRRGTVLPKGHGRLIDAYALTERMKQRHYEIADEESYWVADIIATALNPNNGYAPTIIEADKEANE